jgi:hypothetical protein
VSILYLITVQTQSTVVVSQLNRRTVLRLLGTGAGSSLWTHGESRVASGERSRPDDQLRLIGRAEVATSHETVVYGDYAYVATGSGMAVVDWHNPGDPRLVAEIDLRNEFTDPALAIKDVTVDGSVAALANDTENPGGIVLYDVTEPTNPEFRAVYEPESPANIHNCYVDGTYAYLTLGEPTSIDTDGDDKPELVRLSGDAGTEIVDISEPGSPEHAATWRLKDHLPNYANAGINPNHDIYVQDGRCYNAFWDAGVVILEVSEPSDPQFLTQCGAAPNGDTEIRPWEVEDESFNAYSAEVVPEKRHLSAPGNAHYVQPSPDGTLLFVGAETFRGAPGGIDIWDISRLDATERIGRIEPPDVDAFRTSHNFDVTADRLYASWYEGGVRVYDTTDPRKPTEIARFDPEGYSFWTAIGRRGFIIGGLHGDASNDGGITVLRADRRAKRPPGVRET